WRAGSWYGSLRRKSIAWWCSCVSLLSLVGDRVWRFGCGKAIGGNPRSGRGQPLDDRPITPAPSPAEITILTVSSFSRKACIALFLGLLAALAAVGCGGSDSSSSPSSDETKAAAAPPTGEVDVRWQEPATEADELGYEMLKASETEMLAKTLAETFQLP